MEDAARKIELFEEQVVCHGLPEVNIKGLALCSQGESLTVKSKPEQLLETVAEGITVFAGRSIEGPHTFFVGAKLWKVMSATLQGYPAKMQAENILNGKVVLSPYLRGKYANGAFMLSQRGGDLALALGKDLSVGYESHMTDTVKLHATESFTFRILEPAAVIHFQSGK